MVGLILPEFELKKKWNVSARARSADCLGGYRNVLGPRFHFQAEGAGVPWNQFIELIRSFLSGQRPSRRSHGRFFLL